MNCFKSKKKPAVSLPEREGQNPEPKTLKHEILLQIPGCRVHLMDEGEAIELANGDLTLSNVLDEGVCVAAVVKVGEDLQWPLTKDEPVVKIDGLNYLFSLPMRDEEPLSYGVSFVEESRLGLFDGYLKEHCCFSSLKSNHNNRSNNKEVNWKEFAPRIEDYNNVLARAIAGGTGQIVKGIFMCSNAYTNQVQKGGEMTLTSSVNDKKGAFSSASESESRSKKSNGDSKKNKVNKSLKRVRRLSKMTEKMSKAMLNGVGIVSGSLMGPVVRSQAGKKLLSMVPGEILLASLDAVNKVLDAAEVAEKQALSATSGAATRMVSQRYGESAGEATGDVIATAGHCCGTAWNIFKIRRAINPASSVSTGVLSSAAKTKKS
ncbi:hypothetical protein LguiA_020046 [Lonicera macranthoides]